ncbi:SAM-dependent methyltransferase [Streptomyces sp. NPDC088348]|uniref:SAM-dependent methyltransferase n=1 Tax=Streptomyces sp. NPDC088348 TaxID=3365853 RepID=UPI0037F3E332
MIPPSTTWTIHDLAEWRDLMAPRAFIRLDTVERARLGEGPAYLTTPTCPRRAAPRGDTVSVKDINTHAWTTYGKRQLSRACTPPIPDHVSWTPWEGVGPGAEVLGDITGRRVLDIGSGAGHHAVHLAQAHGARVTGRP